MQNGTRLAAIDLGSNSFRLEIGSVDHGQIHRNEYLKETVRQGNGLDEYRNLTDEAMQRGWDCLSRFGERLTGFKPTQVRAVATQTLREARNRELFLLRAREILGFPIDVISGHEEARLIYQGVAHFLPQSLERRLVIDIGGRSTELVLGQQLSANAMASYRVGSVAWSMKYFFEGQLTEASFKKAEIAAKAVLDDSLNTFQNSSWDLAYGSSGTVGAVFDVLKAAGWSETVITRESLQWLREKLIKSQHIDRIKLAGLKEDRRAVIGGGVSILIAIFDLLGVANLYPAEGALRHGVLYDLLERDSGETNFRNMSVARLANNFNIDTAQATRVSKTAAAFLLQIQSNSNLGKTDAAAEIASLEWAAQLHEIGCQISHSDYHKHGAYILDNADLSGFAVPELHRLSMLVFGHRGKLKKLEFELENASFAYQLLSLRLAVILCHARNNTDIDNLKLTLPQAERRHLTLSCPPAWSLSFPQSAHLLREEVIAWGKTNWTLQVTGIDS
jgi:exopolyphosphatase / guanosine-5'-triphosphate,3'-diphosphate pyrophosphatase